MAGGTPAGRLSIELIAEVARLQQGVEQAKRMVSAMSADIGRDAKAANDNLARMGDGAGIARNQILALGAASKDVLTRIEALTGVSGEGFRRRGEDIAAYGAELDRLRAKFNPVYAVIQRYRAAQDEVRQAHRVGAISADEMAAAISRERQAALGSIAAIKGHATQMNVTTVSAGAARAGMQQLSFQIGDVAQQFAMGTSPMIIFAQQGGQVIQAVQLMTGATKGFIGFLAGPWGAVLTGAAIILGTMTAKYLENEKAVNDVKFATNAFSDAQGILGGVIDITTGKVTKQASAYRDLALAQAMAARIQAQVREKEARDQIRGFQGLPDYAAMGLTGQGALFAEMISGPDNKAIANISSYVLAGTMNAKSAITTLETLQAKGKITEKQFIDTAAAIANMGAEAANVEEYKKLEAALQGDTKALDHFLEIKDKHDKSSERLAERLARESQATEALIAGLYKLAEAYKISDAAAMQAEATAKATEAGIKKRAELEAFVSQQLRKTVAEQVVQTAKLAADLNFQAESQELATQAVANGTLAVADMADAVSVYREQRAAAAAVELATSIGDTEGALKAAAALNELTEAQNRALAAAKAAADVRGAAQVEIQTASLQKEIELTQRLGKARIGAMRGMSGRPLEEELASIEAERQKALITIRDEEAALQARNDKQFETAKAILRQAEAEKQLIDLEEKFRREADAVALLNDRVSALVGSLGNLSGAGGILGKLAGVLTSRDPTSALLGMGGLGTVAGLLTGGGMDAYRKLGDEVATSIDRILRPGLKGEFDRAFGQTGTLAQTMSNVLQGAGVGSAVGGILGGGKNSQLGSMIGGALGQEFGGKLIGAVSSKLLSSLGGAAGPLGAIAGSLLGGLVGGLLDTNRTARAAVTSSGFSVGGKDKGSYGAANDLGSALFEGIQRLNDMLGTTLGDFKIAIGMRGDQIRLNTTGSTSLKFDNGAVGFGQDSKAAITAGLQAAIAQDAFKGLTEGEKLYLQNAKDLDKALGDLVSLKQIADQAAQLRDPQGFAMKELDAWRTEAIKAAEAVGSSTVDIEYLYGQKRLEILQQVGDDTLEREQRLREKQIELQVALGNVAKATALAEQLRIDQSEDYLQAIEKQIIAAEKATTLAQTNAAIQAQINQIIDPALAQRIERENAVKAATDETTQKLLLKLYAEQDQAAQAAAQAEEAARIADERAGLQRQILELMGDENGLREIERATIAAGNFDLFDRVTALRAEAAATAAAAQAAQELADKQRAIADEIGGLERQLLEARGQREELRDLDLAKLQSDRARELQQELWDYADAQEAAAKATEAARAAEDLRAQKLNALTQAYQRQAGELQATIDKFSGFARQLADVRDGLIASSLSPAASLALAQRQFDSSAAMARFGDETALQALGGRAQTYADLLRSTASSEVELQRGMARIFNGLNGGVSGAQGMVSEAERQLMAIEKLYGPLVESKDATISLEAAFDDYQASFSQDVAAPMVEAVNANTAAVDAQTAKVEEQGKKDDTHAVAVLSRLAALERMMRASFRGNGFNVTADDALDVEGEITGTVEVTNTVTVESA